MRGPASLVIIAAFSVAACSGSRLLPAERPTAILAAPVTVTSPVDGQVIRLDTEGLTKVRGFTLRTDAGQELAFTIGVLENGATFPPSHLAEHMATGTPVRVDFRMEDGVPVVYRVEDAPAS